MSNTSIDQKGASAPTLDMQKSSSEQSKMIIIKVRTIKHETHEVEIDINSDMTSLDLKLKVNLFSLLVQIFADKLRDGTHTVKLIYQGRILEDSKRLRELSKNFF